MARPIQEVDRDLLVLRGKVDMEKLFPGTFSEIPQAVLIVVKHYMLQALDVLLDNSAQTLELKSQLLSGEGERGFIGTTDEIISRICAMAESLMNTEGKSNPQQLALSLGLCCYGAILCSDEISAGQFGDLFARCWIKAQTC